MTVRELIAALQAMPQDVEVLSEGCDCTGDVVGVELDSSSQVMLHRLDGPDDWDPVTQTTRYTRTPLQRNELESRRGW